MTTIPGIHEAEPAFLGINDIPALQGCASPDRVKAMRIGEQVMAHAEVQFTYPAGRGERRGVVTALSPPLLAYFVGWRVRREGHAVSPRAATRSWLFGDDHDEGEAGAFCGTRNVLVAEVKTSPRGGVFEVLPAHLVPVEG